MIGIVVVSHSRALADAAVALAGEMVDESRRPPIQVAAGLDESTFGTDAGAVAEAISAVDGDDGVLVLLDLGSAVLSAEMAMEFLDPEVAERVRLSSAPLVEGLVAAVVTASTGADLDAVLEEARAGLTAKQDHLGDTEPAGDSHPAAAAAGAPAASTELDVSNEHGLHARPAARLVALVRGFDAEVLVTNLRTGKGPVDARSLSRVATLDARMGDRVRVEVHGPQASDALAAVTALAADGWGDVPAPAEPDAVRSGATAGRTGSGLDMAIGPAVVADHEVDTSGYEPADPEEEQHRSDAAVHHALADLAHLADDAAGTTGPDAAAVFQAHRAMLEDPELLAEVQADIAGGQDAVHAWGTRLASVAAAFEDLPDPYQRERAQDVRSVRRRMLAALTGTEMPDASGAVGVLVVPELDAVTAAVVNVEQVTGIVTLGGGATGHGVIVARSRGIPIITDMAEAAAIRSGVLVAFDARRRRLVIDPDPATREEFRTLAEARATERGKALAAADEPATTTDGVHVAVEANVTSVEDAVSARAQGADGSGLVRTEVLFGHEAAMPSTDAQAAAFRRVAAAFDGRPVTIRTWDVGGDKPLPFLPQPVEANPFLGERGLRLVRRAPDVLQAQLRAVCQVAREHPVHVMFPMVTTAEEVAWAREQLRVAAGDSSGGLPDGMRVGIMVEVPAAAVRARVVAEGLDFVSIGTNDLTQYTTAAERGNAAVAELADACDPAVLELIGQVCAEVGDETTVAVCGDLASDPDAAVLLVGLGVRELSAVAARVPLVKASLREVSLAEAEELAARALECRSAAEVRRLIADRRG